MDIQTEKIELARMILSTNGEASIDQIKVLFKGNNENWWDELPEMVKQGIRQSIDQADRGEFIPLDKVKEEVSALLRG